MQLGDILINSEDNQVYIVKAYHPNPKRIFLLDLGDGKQFSILKSIARHWIPNTQGSK